jgi:ArsR family transcriptional regulator, arsenate/arsenite/antimonite-responsive transcriptional repressor
MSTKRKIGADSAKDRELGSLAKALGHPTRVAILRFLCQRGGCICGTIVDQLPFAQATVSQHLKVLKEAGLLQGTIDGPRVCYCPDSEALARLKTLIDELRPKEAGPC